MLTALGFGNTELSLVLTDDAGIREMTRDWFGGPTVTDVLSFPLDEHPPPLPPPGPPLNPTDGVAPDPPTREDSGPPHLLGDIVLNIEEARRRAVPTDPDAPLGTAPTNTAAPPNAPRAMTDADTLAELDRLLAHGLCHLAGYDHERGATDAAAMQARERELLAAVHDS